MQNHQQHQGVSLFTVRQGGQGIQLDIWLLLIPLHSRCLFFSMQNAVFRSTSKFIGILMLLFQRAFELVILKEWISTNRGYTVTVFLVYCMHLTWEVTSKCKITDLKLLNDTWSAGGLIITEPNCDKNKTKLWQELQNQTVTRKPLLWLSLAYLWLKNTPIILWHKKITYLHFIIIRQKRKG